MKSFQNILIIIAFLIALSPVRAQSSSQATASNTATAQPSSKIVVVTGNRFSYKLVQKWIDDYNKVAPHVQVIIESRGTTDPSKYDILAEAYPMDEAIRKNREYLNVGRYVIFPVATGKSPFATLFSEKGLTTDLIKQIYFNDIFAEKEKQQNIDVPYVTYTRLKNAGAPLVFAKYFGYQQKDFKGNTIAGADEHLLKALLRDPNGVSYLPLPLIYDQQTRKPVEGLAVVPVDLNGNGKLGDDEKFYDNLDKVIETLEKKTPADVKNIPFEYLHLSVDKQTASPEAIDFLKWVNENGHGYLHDFGYLLPEDKHLSKEKFNEFASEHNRQR